MDAWTHAHTHAHTGSECAAGCAGCSWTGAAALKSGGCLTSGQWALTETVSVPGSGLGGRLLTLGSLRCWEGSLKSSGAGRCPKRDARATRMPGCDCIARVGCADTHQRSNRTTIAWRAWQAFSSLLHGCMARTRSYRKLVIDLACRSLAARRSLLALTPRCKSRSRARPSIGHRTHRHARAGQGRPTPGVLALESAGGASCKCAVAAWWQWVRTHASRARTPGGRSWEAPPPILLTIGRDACRLEARAAERVEATASEARSNFTIRVSFILTTLR